VVVKCSKCNTENTSDSQFCKKCATPLPPSKDIRPEFTETIQTPIKELTTGSTFAGRYQIIEELGKGGMGKVYRAVDKKLNEEVAIKLIKPEIALDKGTLARFQNELKVARKISHRNVGRMYELMEDQGLHFITMEYVPGEDLRSFLHRSKQLTVGTAVAIAKDVCEGLAEAHRLGVVHRDLKPSNIIIDKDGNARIMDFGIARSLRTKSITGEGVIIGTPEYMSPEQVEGKDVDQRSDIYSLGVILYEMLTGRVPFEGETPLSVAVRQKTEVAPDPRKSNAQVPEDLSYVILKCLEKDKAKRYQDVAEVRAELEKIEKGIPTTERVALKRKTLTSREITVKFTLRKIFVPALIAIAIVAAGLLALFLIPKKEPARHAIAVISFKNQTGDKSFDYLQEAIPNLLITSLEQSKYLRVTTWERMKDVLKQMGKDAGGLIDEDSGFELCKREGIEAIVLGSFVKAGEMFATDAKVLEVGTKKLLKSVGARGEGVGSILKSQIDELSRNISRGIGLSERKIALAAPAGIIALTTNSIEAYQYFLRGRDDYEKFFFPDAQKFLKKAVELDPTFAVAYLYLARADGELRDYKARDEAYERAKKYSMKVTEKERLYIEAAYASVVEKSPEKRFRILSELVKKYPEEKYAHYDLALYYEGRRQYREAIEENNKAIALDPNFGSALNQAAYDYASLGDIEKAIEYFGRYASVNPGLPNPIDSIAELYLRMGKLDEAIAKYKEALAIKPDFYSSCVGLAYSCALKENYPETIAWVDQLIERSPDSAKWAGSWLKAYFDYFFGRWDRSLAEYLALKKQSEKEGAAYTVATVAWITGYLYSDLRQFDMARESDQKWNDYNSAQNPSYKASNSADKSYALGWVDLKQGWIEGAKARLAEIKPLLPNLDSSRKKSGAFYYDLLNAEVLLAEGSIDGAIAQAEKIVLPDPPMMDIASIVTTNQPFLKDVLARAYWKKGELDKAIAEYRRLTTIDPTNQLRFLIHPLYHYRLGRVYEEKGDKAEAREEYQKFLEFWKDADPGLPEVEDAQKRLAGLKTP
jgi:serine/threonine protein kinase/predicted Zn-dependent protease